MENILFFSFLVLPFHSHGHYSNLSPSAKPNQPCKMWVSFGYQFPVRIFTTSSKSCTFILWQWGEWTSKKFVDFVKALREGVKKRTLYGQADRNGVFYVLSDGLPEHFCVANCLIWLSLSDKGRFCSTVKICMDRDNLLVPILSATLIFVCQTRKSLKSSVRLILSW